MPPEGAGRRKAQEQKRLSGAPHAASLVPGPLFRARADEHNLAPIQAAFAALQPVHVQPLKGSPHLWRWARAVVRDDPGSWLRGQNLGRHTLLRSMIAS